MMWGGGQRPTLAQPTLAARLGAFQVPVVDVETQAATPSYPQFPQPLTAFDCR